MTYYSKETYDDQFDSHPVWDLEEWNRSRETDMLKFDQTLHEIRLLLSEEYEESDIMNDSTDTESNVGPDYTGSNDTESNVGSDDTGSDDTELDVGSDDTGSDDTELDVGPDDTGSDDTELDVGPDDTESDDTELDVGPDDTGSNDTESNVGPDDTELKQETTLQSDNDCISDNGKEFDNSKTMGVPRPSLLRDGKQTSLTDVQSGFHLYETDRKQPSISARLSLSVFDRNNGRVEIDKTLHVRPSIAASEPIAHKHVGEPPPLIGQLFCFLNWI